MSFRQMLILLTTVAFLFPQVAAGQLVALNETFDSDSSFSKVDGAGAPLTFFSDGADSFFGISEGGGAGDFGGDPVPTGNRWNPIDGGFLALEDLDGAAGMTLPLVLKWQGIDISALSDLRVETQIAAISSGFGPTDHFIVSVSIDGGPFETLANYRAGGFTDSFLFEDRDGDGIGDGGNLQPIFGGPSIKTWTIPTTGTTLDLELRIHFDDPSETLAIDNLRVVGDRVLDWTAAAPGDFFNGASWSLGFVPEMTDQAMIRNGGSALADGSVPGAPSTIEANRLVVGDHQGNGSFESAGVNLYISGDLDIGSVEYQHSSGIEDLDLTGSFVIQNAPSLKVDDRAQIGVTRARGNTTVSTTTSALIENVTTMEVKDLDVGGPLAYDSGTAATTVDFTLRGSEQVNVTEDLWIAVGATASSQGTARYDVSALIEDVTTLNVADQLAVMLVLSQIYETTIAEVDLTLRDISSLSVGSFLMPRNQLLRGLDEDAASNTLEVDALVQNTVIDVSQRVEWSSFTVNEDASMDSYIQISMVDSTLTTSTDADIEIGGLAGGGGQPANRLHTEVALRSSSISSGGNLSIGVWADDTPGDHLTAAILDDGSSLQAEHLILGTGCQLKTHLDGPVSVLDGALGDPGTFSAIQATEADLDGSITAVFDYFPPPGSHDFDLVITGSPTALDDFAAVLEVEGLDPGFSVDFFGVVEEGGVDRLRLTISGAPTADLNIRHLKGPGQVIPGRFVTYTTQVGNAGPGDALGARVENAFLGMSGCSWNCTPTGGATCTPSGLGAIDEAVDLPVGGLLTYRANCRVAPGAVGVLSNTARIIPGSGAPDPTEADNFATDLSNLIPQADLSITNDNGESVYLPGDIVIYTITARNHGPSHAPDSRLTDFFPELLQECLWECSAAGGAFCSPGPTHGNIDQRVDLPVGGTVTFTAACMVQPDASDDMLINEASVTTASTVTELQPVNNTAIDADESQNRTVFTDDFESGDFSRWSVVVPEP